MYKILILFLALISVANATGTFVTHISTPTVIGNYTEEIWVYFKDFVPDSKLSVLYDASRSEVQLSLTTAKLATTIYDYNIPGTKAGPEANAKSDLAPKIYKWTHVAVTFTQDATSFKCSLFMNGVEIPCTAFTGRKEIFRVFFLYSHRNIIQNSLCQVNDIY